MLAKLYNSNNILWDGGNIPCINICKNTYVSDVIYKIAKELCCVINEIGGSYDVDLKCLIDYCKNCNKLGLKNLLQLMIDNDCSLLELINKLNSDLEEKLTIKLSLKYACSVIDECSVDGVFNECGELINPYNYNGVLQFIIYKLCCQKAIIFGLQQELNSLNEVYNNNVENVNIYTEPSFISCLFSQKRKHSTHDNKIAGILCQLSNKTFDNELINDENTFNTNISQYAEIANLKELVEEVESRTCCKDKCSDVEIGVKFDYNPETPTLTVIFSNDWGTFIPDGWEDAGGSTIDIEDNDTNFNTFPLVFNYGNFAFTLPDGVSTGYGRKIITNIKLKKGNLYCTKNLMFTILI